MGSDGTGFRLLPFQGPKSLDFQGAPLPMALVMDLARINIIMSPPYKRTLIVILGWHESCGYLRFEEGVKRVLED